MEDAAESANPSARRVWLGRAIRLAVVAVMVWWLYRHTEINRLRHVLAAADWRLALLGLLALAPVAALFGLRLRWLLVVHDIHISYWTAVKVTFIGNFLIHALPVGTPGGDAVKAWYIARETPKKHEAVMSVFFDRVVGVAGLVLMSGFMILLNWRNPAMTQWVKPIGLSAVALAAGGGLYFSRRVRTWLALDRIMAVLPLARHLQRIDQAVFAFRHRRMRVAASLLLTIALQFCAIVSTFLCGWALGLVGGDPLGAFPLYLAYVPICFLSGVLPLGAMELMYAQFFTPGLGPWEAGISLSLLSRLTQLIWALPGGAAVLGGQVQMGGSKPPAASAGMRTGVS